MHPSRLPKLVKAPFTERRISWVTRDVFFFVDLVNTEGSVRDTCMQIEDNHDMLTCMTLCFRMHLQRW